MAKSKFRLAGWLAVAGLLTAAIVPVSSPRADGQPDERQLAGPGFGLHRRPRRHEDRARHGPGRLAVRARRASTPRPAPP